jgi:hypothetical protein
MANFLSWTYEKARPALLPNVRNAALGVAIPHYWRRWEVPRPKLPIDDVVRKIIASDKSAWDKSKPNTALVEAFASRCVLCPYYVAREYVIYAVARAAREIERQQSLKAERTTANLAREAIAQITEAAGVIERRLKEVSQRPPLFDLEPGIDAVDVRAALARRRTHGLFAKAAEDFSEFRRSALLKLEPPYSEEKPSKQSVEDYWLRTFIGVMSELWVFLTGEPPPKTETQSHKHGAAFDDLISNALQSVDRDEGLDVSGQQLKLAIARAREKPNEWDRPDSVAKGSLPPGVSRHMDAIVAGVRFVKTESGSFEVLREPIANWEKAISGLEPPRRARRLDLMTSVEVEGRRRAFIWRAGPWLFTARSEAAPENERRFAKRMLLTWWRSGDHLQRRALQDMGYEPPPPSTDG